MSDLISRQAAIDALKKLLYETALVNSYDATISDVYAEMAENRIETWVNLIPPVQRWILCSERMPEKYDEYYVTWTSDNFKRPLIEIIECDETNEFDYELYRFKMEWLLNETMKAYDNPKVIAWMPLPEPYKEVKND